MRQLLTITLLSLVTFFTMSACLDVAEDRAAQEAKVGQAQLNGVSVEVNEGLAAIRSMSIEAETLYLNLWTQAPAIRFKINIGEGSSLKTLELTLQNVMSGSELISANSSKATLSFERPTIAIARVELNRVESSFNLIPPSPSQGDPWRFALFADVQERLNGVADLFDPLGQERGVRFALISGDLTERGSVEELNTFQDEMQQRLPFPCYATLGNHELGSSGVPFHQLFGRGTFSFTYGDVRFSLLDGASATIAPSSRKLLSAWLNKAREQLHVFATHIPIIDPDGSRGGAFASRLEAASLLNELRRHDVDLLLYGHVHTYRYFYQAGMPAMISGGGGSIPMRFDGIGRHYVVFDVDEERSNISHRVVRIYPAE